MAYLWHGWLRVVGRILEEGVVGQLVGQLWRRELAVVGRGLGEHRRSPAAKPFAGPAAAADATVADASA